MGFNLSFLLYQVLIQTGFLPPVEVGMGFNKRGRVLLQCVSVSPTCRGENGFQLDNNY